MLYEEETCVAKFVEDMERIKTHPQFEEHIFTLPELEVVWEVDGTDKKAHGVASTPGKECCLTAGCVEELSKAFEKDEALDPTEQKLWVEVLQNITDWAELNELSAKGGAA